MLKQAALLAVLLAVATTVAAQNPPRPRPFPTASPPATEPDAAATDPELGLPIYPGSELLARHQPGPNQTMFIYGTPSSYAIVVEYYRGMLKDRGRQLFGGPMHQFDLGRYRRDSMTLQPSLTVKDYTWNGRDGYVHVSGRQILKYPTVIQIVPAGPDR